MPFPLPKSKIAATELALGVRFPLSYLARLLKDNGGEVQIEDDTWWLFPFPDDTDRKRVSRTANHIVYETKQLRERPSFRADAVGIATDGGGNALVLLPDPADASFLQDAVYVWDHETGEVSVVAESCEEVFSREVSQDD